MPVSLAEMKARLSPEERAEVERQAAEIKAQVKGLQALRMARASTQVEVAQRLGVSQASVAKMEQRADVLLSTLRQYVEALGGHLDLVARFDDAEPVHIAGLTDIDGAHEASGKVAANSASRRRKTSKPRAPRVVEAA